ncbi:MAG: hypothetical protein WCW31_00245 [Patescibacteria group bacterium]|jgi:hypothetical protein
MKYGKYTLGQVEAVFNMIGGETAVDAVLSRTKRIALEDVGQPEKFVALVVYAIPAMDELKRRFPDYVNQAYDGIAFKPIKACENVIRETREVEFEYVCMNRNASYEEVLAEIDKRGLRSALPEELLALDAKYPEEKIKFPMVALGSETDVDGHRNVACLWSDGAGQRLRLVWFDSDWHGNDRFLCVRKEEELAA